ncbi:MAG: hypothetical protein HPM95_19760 [Alphaproteobacteria bacterium]|nr:hypothetical protein [Alphaproteobacteria bacterium]
MATLEGEGDEFSLSGLSGRIAGTEVDADLQIDLRRSVSSLQPQVRGSAVLSELDPAALGDLLLGADQLTAARGGADWPSIAFGPPVVSGVDVALDVTARRMPLGPSLEASEMTGTLGLRRCAQPRCRRRRPRRRQADRGIVRETNRRAGRADASMRVENGALGDFIWRRNARPVATGRMDLSLDLEGTGARSPGSCRGSRAGRHCPFATARSAASTRKPSDW